jgi:DNA-binding XRE family transcriptional regulator
LAEQADVSENKIRSIESGMSPYKTTETIAEALAEALGVNVYDIFDPSETSHLGRPAHTSKPITAPPLLKVNEMLCKDCNIVYPRSVGCADCNEKQVA